MKFTGTIKSIKEKTTRNGNVCLAYLCETAKGNTFWFMAWDKTYNTASRKEPPASPFYVGQTLTVDVDPPSEDNVNENKKTGKKMVFLPPNPALLRISAPTPEMVRAAKYGKLIRECYGPKRIAKALLVLWEKYEDRIDASESEFVESLKDQAEASGSLTAKQAVYAGNIVAKYAARITELTAHFDKELRNMPQADPDDQPVGEIPADERGPSGPPADLSDTDF